jgi:hypothetical protein
MTQTDCAGKRSKTGCEIYLKEMAWRSLECNVNLIEPFYLVAACGPQTLRWNRSPVCTRCGTGSH